MPRSRTASQLDTSLALAAQNRLFDAALDNMIQDLCMFDDSQRLIVCNRRHLEIYGFSADVVRPGVSLREILAHSVAIGNYAPDDAHAALTERPVQADLPTEATYEQHLADGRIIAVMHRPMPSGGSVATYQDITAQRRQEAENIELARIATAAAAANRAKSAFLANMSHELRTPINAIVGFAETIVAGIHGPLGSPKYAEYLTDIVASARQLTRTIDDVLEMSRAEAGELELDENAFDLRAALADAVAGVEPAAAERRIQIVATCELAAVRLHGDRAKVVQSLVNILSNAIKFTSPGGTVLTRLAPSSDGVAIRVSDTGIGMTRGEIERALTPFGQSAGAYARHNGGSGLGLPIGRAFIEAHGGTLEIESTPGRSSVVTVTLPAARVVGDIETPPPTPVSRLPRRAPRSPGTAAPSAPWICRCSSVPRRQSPPV